jgi:large subunit ribosomal protein L4
MDVSQTSGMQVVNAVPTVPVYDMQGATVGECQLADAVFGAPVNVPLLHQAVVMYQANRRRGTAATRTRGDVSGGGRKPWRQKGTGRARQGSIRAPHWKGGGTVFGPQPRDWGYAIPRKARRQALRGALSAKVADGAIRVLDRLEFERPRTREMAAVLERLNVRDTRVLVVTAGRDETVHLSARNLPDAAVRPAADLNALDVLTARTLVITRDAVARVEAALGGSPQAEAVAAEGAGAE